MAAFELTRSVDVDAPPERVHALIADFRNWLVWSPWEGADENLQREYSGPDSGVGARYAWNGNKKAGSGSMVIVDDKPDRVEIDLTFTEPMAAQNKAVFSLLAGGDGATAGTAAGDSTRVLWIMTGTRNTLMSIAGALFFDRMLGKDFERGLASLKAAAETP